MSADEVDSSHMLATVHTVGPSMTRSLGTTVLGRLPGAGLLLLTGRDAVLDLAHSLCLDTDEDRQEEHSSLDFVSVVATLRSLNEMPEGPPESRKIRGFQATLEDGDQPASSYRLQVGGASADILVDINGRISSPPLGAQRRCRGFFSIRGVHSRCFCRFEGEKANEACSLNRHMTELAGL